MNTLPVISCLAVVLQVAAATQDKCKPRHSFKDAKAACMACQLCRQWNKCPCSSYMEDGEAFFCFDSSSPDALQGDDLHRQDMHCDKLTKSAIQTCADNAVHGVQTLQTADESRLYSAEPPRVQGNTKELISTNPVAWAAAALMSFMTFGVALIRLRRIRDVSMQDVEMSAHRHDTFSVAE